MNLSPCNPPVPVPPFQPSLTSPLPLPFLNRVLQGPQSTLLPPQERGRERNSNLFLSSPLPSAASLVQALIHLFQRFCSYPCPPWFTAGFAPFPFLPESTSHRAWCLGTCGSSPSSCGSQCRAAGGGLGEDNRKLTPETRERPSPSLLYPEPFRPPGEGKVAWVGREIRPFPISLPRPWPT